MREPIVSTQWLAARLDDERVRILDGSWYLPSEGRDPKAEFEARHIPGARFFPIDEISDPASPLPHMLPSADAFGDAVSQLGIGNDDRVIVYDGAGLFSAARVWWTFRAFGHESVAVLDGGWPRWTQQGRPVQTGPVTPAPRAFRARVQPELIQTLDRLRLHDGQIVDARAQGRFEGTVPEPRAGLRSGHIPGSRNLPFTALVEGGALRAPAAIRAAFEAAGIDPDREVVTTCGSGITASVLALALFTLGNPRASVYDGSWSEWGARDDTPVATGPAAPAFD